MSNEIIFTVENNIAILRVNRPQARNALNWAAQQQFADYITAVSRNSDIRILIISGSGDKAFVAGGDIKELSQHHEPDVAIRLNQIMRDALVQMTELPLPVIAAINGDAFGGGCEILTACDLRMAAAHVRLSFAQVKNALTTGWGGTGRLVRLLGQSRAMDLLLTTRMLSVDEAQEMGLVHRIVPPDEDLLTAVTAWANELAQLPQTALAATKTLTQAASQLSITETNNLETELFVGLWPHPDHIEAMNAFVQKRPPHFNKPPLDE